MASTTDNYNLPLYDTGDPANLRDQYNNAMGVIDGELKTLSDTDSTINGTVSGLDSKVTGLESAVSDVESLAQANKTNIAATDANLKAVESLLDTAGITNNETAQDVGKKLSTLEVNIDYFKETSDTDYTSAWNKCLDYIGGNQGTIVINSKITGTFILGRKNIKITGNGEINSPIIINDENASNGNESNISIHDITINVSNNDAVKITRGINVNVKNCTIVVDDNHACIFSNEVPTVNQQIARCTFAGNTLIGGTGIDISAPNTDVSSMISITYLGADIHIQNNECNNKIRNIHLGLCDGGIISNNTLFLSQGGASKKENIFLDAMSFAVVSNNNCFEAGTNGIHITYNNTANVCGNNIIWPGQYVVSSGIFMEKGTCAIPVSKLSYNSITNNTVIKASGHGIECNDKNFNTYVGNSIHDTGNFEHWKGGEHDTRPAYSVYDNGDYVGYLANVCGGTYGSRLINNNNGLEFSLDNPNTVKVSPNVFSLGSTTITDASDIQYSNKINLFVINGITEITKEQLLANVKVQPILAVFSVYSQSCTIASTAIEANSAKIALIYGNDIRWL